MSRPDVIAITKTFARSLFDYRDGRLFWRWRDDVSESTNKARVGREAGANPKTNGYHSIKISGRFYRRSRIVWAWHFGEIACGKVIDHSDRNRGNDRIENLRIATVAQNNFNQPERENICSRGVALDKRWGRYQARIAVSGSRINLGSFATKEAAEQAYAEAAKVHYGEFCPSQQGVNHG